MQRDLYGGPSLPNTDPPNPAYAVLTGANENLIRIPLRNSTDAITFNAGAEADFASCRLGCIHPQRYCR